jgi:hypothetical protein
MPLAQFAGLVEEERGAAEAEPYWRRAVQCAEAALDPGDPEIAAAYVGLASVCRDLGKDDEARAFAERARLRRNRIRVIPIRFLVRCEAWLA